MRVFGARQYSMRVWLDPNRLRQFNLTAADVLNAVGDQKRTAYRRADRRAADGQRAGVSAYDQQPRQAFGRETVRRHHSEERHQRPQRPDRPHPGPRSRGAGPANVRRLQQRPRQEVRGDRCLRAAGGERHSRGGQRLQDGGLDEQGLPGGAEIRHTLRYDEIRPGVRVEGVRDAHRGRHTGPPRHHGLPAEFQGPPRPRDYGARHDRRRFRGDDSPRLHDQPDDAFRAGAGHRDRC